MLALDSSTIQVVSFNKWFVPSSVCFHVTSLRQSVGLRLRLLTVVFLVTLITLERTQCASDSGSDRQQLWGRL